MNTLNTETSQDKTISFKTLKKTHKIYPEKIQSIMI